MLALAQWPSKGKLTVVVVGAGNLGHVLAGQLGAREEIEVRMMTRKAAQVAAAMRSEGITVKRQSKEKGIPDTFVTGKLDAVSDRAEDVIPGADFVLITVPSNGRPDIVSQIMPHVSRDKPVFVGAMPGIGGFDWIARQECERLHVKNVTVFSVKDVPFMSTGTVFGKSATNLGPKQSLYLAVDKGRESPEMAICSRIITSLTDNTPCVLLDSFMTITLTPGNPIMHPSIMYGMFGPHSQWDGKPLAEKPLFYEGASELSSYFLSKADADVQNIKLEVSRRTGCDLSCVYPLRINLKQVYGDIVKDNRTLMLAMRTNRAYNTVRTPLKPAHGGGFEPDYTHRFFVEDIPFGLVILRDVADMVGVKTPMIDELLSWAQGLMGREYLVDGKLCGRDMATSGAPSRYGIFDINDLVWGRGHKEARL